MRALISGVSLALLSACSGGLMPTEVALQMDDPAAVGAGLTDGAGCASDATACTPTDVSGRLYAGGAMWGQPGPDAFQITMLGSDPSVILDPSTGMGGALEFSLMEAAPMAGQYAAPERGDEARPVTRMELLVDYLDVAITLDEGSPLAGDWVIRTVLVDEAEADDVSGVMLRGDRLIKRADDATFWWCDKDACSPSVDALAGEPMMDPSVADAAPSDEGNPHYTPVVVELSERVALTGDELNTMGSAWTVTFDATDALELRSAPADLNGPAQLLAAASLTRTGEGDSASVALTADLRFQPGE